jgi:hypothetical protein
LSHPSQLLRFSGPFCTFRLLSCPKCSFELAKGINKRLSLSLQIPCLLAPTLCSFPIKQLKRKGTRIHTHINTNTHTLNKFPLIQETFLRSTLSSTSTNSTASTFDNSIASTSRHPTTTSETFKSQIVSASFLTLCFNIVLRNLLSSQHSTTLHSNIFHPHPATYPFREPF